MEEKSSRKVCLADLGRRLLGFTLQLPLGKATWRTSDLISLLVCLTWKGFRDQVESALGIPPGCFFFARLGPAGPGGRRDCGGGEEQQAV